MIIISSISSLWSITKCDTQSPQMSVMNDLKRHTYLSKKSYEKIKCKTAFWHPESNQNSTHMYVNIFFPFYRDWKGNWKPKRLSWKISPGKPSKGTRSSNDKHLWKLHLHETSSKNQFFLLSLSNFNTFAARPMKTKGRWLRKSKKRRLGVCHMQNKLHKVNNTIQQKINKVQT